jgi:predicted P-loop ATPase
MTATDINQYPYSELRAAGWLDPQLRAAGYTKFPSVIDALVGGVTQGLDEYHKALTVAAVTPNPSKISFLPVTQAPHALTFDSKNHYEASLPNLIHVLGLQKLFALGFDTFRGQIMVAPPGGGAPGGEDWRPMTDIDFVDMREALERQNFAAISGSMMRDALTSVANRNSYDSAVVWLNGLQWDGVARVDTFVPAYCGAVDDAYTRAVSRYIWTGMVCRVMEPGCQLDMVPAFQSRQGGRKSSGLQSLAPMPEFFTDGVSLAHDDPDFKRMIRGKIVVEIAELAGLSKTEVEFIKRMITRRVEEWVEKWDKMTTRYQRRCMLFASTNNIQFLPQDETGQRRWLPVEIERLDDALITRDREQLWAEAKVRWAALKAAGLPGVDFQQAEELAAGRHSKYELVDVWLDKVTEWLDTALEIPGQTLRPAPRTLPYLSLAAVLEGAIGMLPDRQNRVAELRMASVLRKLGYDKKDKKIDGKSLTRWFPKDSPS